MLLRLQTLATGRTGIRRATAELYAAMLNAGITPVVGEYGSLGCSGDLAPLSHVALAAMGEGVVELDGETMDASAALVRAGLAPVVLAEKEGLALVNGTDGMLAMLCLALADLDKLLDTADLTAAMSVEGLLGTDAPFAADLMALRPHAGQATSAAQIDRRPTRSGRYARRRAASGSRGSAPGSPGLDLTATDPRRTSGDLWQRRCAPAVAGGPRTRGSVRIGGPVARWHLRPPLPAGERGRSRAAPKSSLSRVQYPCCLPSALREANSPVPRRCAPANFSSLHRAQRRFPLGVRPGVSCPGTP